jgi:predicted Zn finger-like uncharacterized protein
MVLDCPSCRTRYLIPASAFATGSRQVRCARCKHSWKAELPKEIEVVAAPMPELPPPPQKAAPIPPGSNLPTVVKAPLLIRLWQTQRAGIITFLAVLCVGIALGNWLAPQIKLPKNLPASLPDAMGISLDASEEGLEFVQMRSELKYDDGITKLILNGKIKNKSKKSQNVQPIIAQAVGPDGNVIQSWQIDPPAAKLGPEEEAAFSSSINAPKGTVVNVIMNFAEQKDAN